MQVGLDLTQAIKQSGRGIARYIRELTPRLADPALDLQLTPCIRSQRWFQSSRVQLLTPGCIPRWLPFSFWMSASGLELFHSFGNHLPAISNVPLSFTIHDFRALDLSPSNGVGARLRRNIQRAEGIICLTEHGRSRLKHYYPDMEMNRVAVIPHGVDHEKFRPQDPDRARQTASRLGITAPFLLQLGSWFSHKNLEQAIRAFAASKCSKEGFHLVFVGGGASKDYRQSLAQLARLERVDEQIHWIENVAEQELPLLLSAASALIQPSRYEGFALPLLEAMAVGLPGVVSDSSCLPEVSGGVWPVCSQEDPEDFASGIDAICLDSERRQTAIAAGLKQAARFTWEQTARETADFFRRLSIQCNT